MNFLLIIVITLLRKSFKNLRIMHEVRYMHRDVSTQNLLIMSLNLLKIVFYDFDKVRHASSYRDTHIELISTLAPKVDGYT